MKIPKTFFLTTVLLLPLIQGYSQETGAPGQGEPIPAAVQPVAQPLSPEASFFYNQLAPYGQWLWIDPYGWVWAPNNVDAGWRPYTDGHWVYADCGWTWVSDLEWGWAPFHYGRWFFHEQRGWCWVPGSEWSPAWVAWHWGDDWCGWAPMPPLMAWDTFSDWDTVIPTFGWSFVGHRDFLHRHLEGHLALVARNGTLLRATRNVTRFEVRDRSVVNLSITPEQIERATGRAVRRFQVADASSPGGGLVSINGKASINIYRPVVSETKMIVPTSGEATISQTRSVITFDQLRRNEDAHRKLEAQQAREREALERLHQSELRASPPGLSARELMERQQAEHRAFNEHVNRQQHVFENRQQSPPSPVPLERSPATTFSQLPATGRRNLR